MFLFYVTISPLVELKYNRHTELSNNVCYVSNYCNFVQEHIKYLYNACSFIMIMTFLS